MTQDTYNEIYKYYKAHIPVPWLKDVINRNGKFRINVVNIGNYFGRVGEDPDLIYQAIKNVLKEEGIVVVIGTDKYKSMFLTFNFNEINLPAKYMLDREKIEKFHKFLENNKLYNEDTKYLLCPECHRYSVEYSTSSYREYDKRWLCNHCLDVFVYYDYNLDISNKDKYHIYKLWGAEALSIFTNKSMKRTIGFVASYFKDCCVTKKDKCLYFDFFKEEDKKYEVEGDIINERGKMGIVRRDARSK